jgi:8-oxo-dGTP diphosphatase
VASEVRAAGGVVIRDGRVLLVHRPEYDDWTIPKGKLDHGESWEDAALREVEEETGLACRLVADLGETRYPDRRGRDKVVRYWLMEEADSAPDEAGFVPNHEVDEVRWLRPAEAATLLTYRHDRTLLDRLPRGRRP